MRRALAFPRRDFSMETSYRFDLLPSLIDVVFSVAIFAISTREWVRA